jgi:primase-polymerase (primpol)-like protein
MVLLDYRKVIPENIPEKLKALNQWVVWKPIPEKGKFKPGKMPISLRLNEATGKKGIKPASCNDPKTWMTFEDAMSILNSSSEYQGLQIALVPKPPDDDTERLIGIDFDEAVLSDGSIRPELLEEVHSFNTYFELSPTDGLRGFCYGHFTVNEGVHKSNIEIYQYGKFLTVTGHKLTYAPATVEPAQEAIITFRAKHFKLFSEIDETNLPITLVLFADEELLTRISKSKLSEKFKNLYYENTSEIADHSVLDKNLCALFAFWTQDKEQIDRLFRKSALFRDKWDEVHGHDSSGPLTYGQMTINYALKTRKSVYNPRNYTPNENEIIQNQAPSTFSCWVYPYNITETGIYKQKHNQNRNTDEMESVDELLSPTPCIITAVGVNIDTYDILYKLYLKDSRGNEKIIWKKSSDLLKKVEVVKLLDEGMHFKESDSTEMIRYFDKFITQYPDFLPEEIVASKSGWKNDFSLFVVGDKAI